MCGRSQTVATRDKIGKANKSKLAGSKNPRARRIKLLSPSGEEFFTFGNLNEFCKKMELNASAIVTVCSGRPKHHKGWRAEYEL